jgi:hypothetical protein
MTETHLKFWTGRLLVFVGDARIRLTLEQPFSISDDNAA